MEAMDAGIPTASKGFFSLTDNLMPITINTNEYSSNSTKRRKAIMEFQLIHNPNKIVATKTGGSACLQRRVLGNRFNIRYFQKP